MDQNQKYLLMFISEYRKVGNKEVLALELQMLENINIIVKKEKKTKKNEDPKILITNSTYYLEKIN